jgi:hypothetical protein
MQRLHKTFIYFLSIITILGSCDTKQNNHLSKSNTTSTLAKQIPLVTLRKAVTDLDVYLNELTQCLASETPIMRLSKDYANPQQLAAQQLAMLHPDFKRDCFETKTNTALHSEVMQISTLNNGLMQVEMYNFYHNNTTVAQVNLKRKTVVNVKHLNAVQPILNKRLQHIAKQVALQYPEVYDYLNVSPNIAVSKLDVNVCETKCERSRHLSAAPVFTNNNNDLWAIVDVNDWKLVGVKEVLTTPHQKPVKITERTIQNEYIMQTYCNKVKSIQQGDWEINYQLTKSDGVEIKDVKYQGTTMIRSAKLVDWHVNYNVGDGYGFSDAMGCPMYSSAAVVAFQAPEINDLIKNDSVVGFSLTQDFRSPVWPLSCNYRYQNKYEFYTDGRFRICGVNMGLGCGYGAMYKPVFRIDLFPGDNASEKIEQWSGHAWEPITSEKWHLQTEKTAYHNNGSLFKITKNNGTGFYVVPSQNLNEVNNRGDNAYSYFSKFHADIDEGISNMETIGPYDSNDYKQGPEKFISPSESLMNKDMVLWYVAQMHNDNNPNSKHCWVDVSIKNGKEHTQVWPGIVGPMFVPFTTP